MNCSFKSLLAALILLCSTVATAHDFEVDGIYYNITSSSNKTVEVTYRGIDYSSYSDEYSGKVIIPATVTKNGITYNVISIDNYAFCENKNLTDIEISHGIITIEYCAFSNCASLSSVIIPNSVTDIDGFAFYKCESIEVLSLPSGIKKVQESCFQNCTNLIDIAIPNSVTSIGYKAFSGCSALTRIIIPGSVTTIGEECFYGCTALADITIPNSVTNVGTMAFEGTEWYNNLSEGLIYIGRVLYKYKGEMPAGTTIKVKEETTMIAAGAFSGCSGLENIEVPESVTSIGEDAFYWTYWYDSQPDGGVYVGNVLYKYKGEMPAGTTIEVRDGVTSIGGSAFYDCDGLTSITIPNSVTTIGEKAFMYCDGLTSVTIGDGVTSIGNKAFYECDRLTNVVISDGVTSIGNNAFSYCSGLTSVTIGDGVTTIGESAFMNCTNLNNVTIPNSVISIGDFAFCGTGIVSIIIPKGITDIRNSTFYGCKKLKRVTLYENVTNIADAAFYDCHNLKIVYNYSPLDITTGSVDNGHIAFYAKIIIKEKIDIQNSFVFTTDSLHTLIDYFGRDSVISLPSNYKGENYKIGLCAFYNDDSLANVTIPNSVTSIGGSAFAYCDGLTNVTIGNGVTSIGGSAFAYCDGLTNVTIGNGVTSIGGSAFYYCSGLTSVTSLATTAPALGSYAFSGISSDATLYYPAGSDYSRWARYFANIEEFEIAEPEVNTIEVTSANMLAGTQALLSFNLKNEDTISGFQFDLHLPNGFAIAKDEMGDEIVYINEERISPSTHSFNTSVNNDGSQLVLVYSLSGAQVRGNEGEVISILVDVAADVAPGNYTVELRDLELVTPEAKTYDIPQSAYTLKVCAPCDANGDGTVSVSDIQMIVNMILNDSDPLENPAANANGDGKISVSDIQVVVNRILGKY